MLYRETRSADAQEIRELARHEVGWTASTLNLEEVLGNYPGRVAIEGGRVVAFLYSSPLSGDIIKISNIVVATGGKASAQSS